MSAASSPVPGQPPGEPRESLLKYFAEVWPAGQRISSVKPTEWSAERDRENDEDDDVVAVAQPQAVPTLPSVRAVCLILNLVDQIARSGEVKGLTLTDLTVPNHRTLEPTRMIVIRATTSRWEWFTKRSAYYSGRWTIIKQDRTHVEAVQIVG
jgi:hypothetical protein